MLTAYKQYRVTRESHQFALRLARYSQRNAGALSRGIIEHLACIVSSLPTIVAENRPRGKPLVSGGCPLRCRSVYDDTSAAFQIASCRIIPVTRTSFTRHNNLTCENALCLFFPLLLSLKSCVVLIPSAWEEASPGR